MIKHPFGRDEKYWSERLSKAEADQESLLCLAVLENFELRSELRQAMQITADRTKELEAVKKVANEMASQVEQLRVAAKIVGQQATTQQKCLVCGSCHGNNMPCPNLIPMAKGDK